MFRIIVAVSRPHRHADIQLVLLLELLRCMMSVPFVGNLTIAGVSWDLCLQTSVFSLGGRKGIRRVKTWVVGCWRGYLSGARCRLAHGPAGATATQLSLASVKSRLVLPFWYRFTRVVPEKRAVKQVCVCVCVCVLFLPQYHSNAQCTMAKLTHVLGMHMLHNKARQQMNQIIRTTV